MSFLISSEKGSYYLQTSMLGYDDDLIDDIVLSEDLITIPPIVLIQSSNLLSTIEIKSKVPLMEMRGDKIVVNVENNISNIDNGTHEILMSLRL